MRIIAFLLFINLIPFLSNAQNFTISGYVREDGSSESLPGVVIHIPSHKIGTSTNNYGFYSITLPSSNDSLQLLFQAAGYKSIIRKIPGRSNIQIDVSLPVEMNYMDEVTVQAERQEKVSETPQMSSIDIPVQQIKDIPALLGEKDVLKVIQLMPGVQKGSEGSSGIYVRGGGPDQNLIILDEAVVYNAFHLFGFFSLFNGDALKSVELTKGGFPAKYGGRLSSVIEMNMKEGNKEKFKGQAGIGLISSRLTLEGPIIKNKSSFLFSARRTYFDVLTRPFMPSNENFGYYFYDMNAKVNYDFGRKNKIYLSGYFGKDRFYGKFKDSFSKSEFGLQWGNATATARWNHLYNDKLFSNTSFTFSNYSFLISQKTSYEEYYYNLKFTSGIRDYSLKHDLDFHPSPSHNIRIGIQSTYHRFTPNATVVKSTDISERENDVKHIDVLESGAYIQDVLKPNAQFSANIGLRLSHFLVQKKSYMNLEPRISMAFHLLPDLALKGSYAMMNQYLNLLSNTGIGLPTDLWVPATHLNPPQRSQQVALGIGKDFLSKNIALSVEGYYKKSNNIINYKEGASFLDVGTNYADDETPLSWQNNITLGKGWSYGAEVLLQKKAGKFSGWIGYTLSWTQLQFDSLNFGKKFYARYDRRHDISFVLIYRPSEKITLSSTWIYGTGNAITLPQATISVKAPSHSFDYFPNNVNLYSSRNGFRMAPYHRLDIGIQFHKKLSWGGERTWEVSVYNAYNRMNPFFYYTDYEFSRRGTKSILKQITLFPLIPSVSYNIKF